MADSKSQALNMKMTDNEPIFIRNSNPIYVPKKTPYKVEKRGEASCIYCGEKSHHPGKDYGHAFRPVIKHKYSE